MPKRLPPEDDPPDLAALVDSWALILRSENKAEATITTYARAVRAYLRWCDQGGHPAELTRAAVLSHTAEMIGAGAEPATARIRQASLRRFSAWLAAEDELP